MPNPVVPANAEAMPRYDRAAIMRRAWEINARSNFGRPASQQVFSRSAFAFYLQLAWQEAKRAQMTPAQRRAELIKDELARLPYHASRTFHSRKAQLEAELASLAA